MRLPCPNISLSMEGCSIDLCRENALLPVQYLIQKSQIFIVQNCLNEFFSSQQIFIKNLNFLLEEMPNSSILIVADFSQYSLVKALMSELQSLIENKATMLVICNCTEDNFCSKFYPPTRVTQNLLTGADWLIPKKNVNYSYLAARKSSSAIAKSLVEIAW
jgi:hypothetical protein